MMPAQPDKINSNEAVPNMTKTVAHSAGAICKTWKRINIVSETNFYRSEFHEFSNQDSPANQLKRQASLFPGRCASNLHSNTIPFHRFTFTQSVREDVHISTREKGFEGANIRNENVSLKGVRRISNCGRCPFSFSSIHIVYRTGF
ncbi:hypothetical protein QE152_g12 [Popillia japonica]|uniref:Uncharacterized protein n=1 Tax=Popillia japonica TaxID=7064 RepID=A0AAW1NKY1_POPJA